MNTEDYGYNELGRMKQQFIRLMRFLGWAAALWVLLCFILAIVAAVVLLYFQ